MTIVGLGYVGLPLATSFARAGFQVVGFDTDAARVECINGGASHIADVPDLAVSEPVKQGLLRATCDPRTAGSSDVFIVCVPTPVDVHKVPDVGYIRQAMATLSPHLRRGQLVVLESTTYPGTTDDLVVEAIRRAGLAPGVDVHVAYSPERIDPGNSRYKVHDIPKVVGGWTPACAEAAKTLYEKGLGVPVHLVSSTRAAEMTKLLENTFRIVNVSLVNELAMLSERMGIDVWEVIAAAKTKPFGFMPFYPGPGMGGHCIPVDAFYLSWRAKASEFTTRFIELAGQINDTMPEYVAERASEVLNLDSKPVRGSRVLLIGLAYKRDVADVRESPALRVAALMLSRGAIVSYHDPHVPRAQIHGVEFSSQPLTPDSLGAADLVIVLTDHSGVDFHAVGRYARLVYDTRNAMQGISGRIIRLGAPQPGPGDP